VTATCPASLHATPYDSRFALCSGTVRLIKANGESSAQTPACDSPDASKKSVPLLAIRGSWSNNQLRMDDEQVTFACAPTFPAAAQIKTLSDFWQRGEQLGSYRRRHGLPETHGRREIFTGGGTQGTYIGTTVTAIMTVVDTSNINTSLNLGVLAKCFFWGYARPGDQQLSTYQACVRAARADYCGSGKSMTQPGTTIQLYDAPDGLVNPPPRISQAVGTCQPSYVPFHMCFEALWNERRALCVSHARYKQMPPEDCDKAALFPNAFDDEGKPVKPEDAVIRCSSADYNAIKKQARLKNRSGINNLVGVPQSCENDIPCP